MKKKSIIEMSEDVAYARNLLCAGTPMYVFDLETTGLNPKTDRILSFSAIRVVLENGVGIIDEKVDMFINPGFSIPKEITKINGISDETVLGCPFEEEAVKEIRSFIGEKPLLVGYNSVKFDEPFLNALYLRTMGEPITPLFHLDVLLMAREKLFLQSHKLSDVAHELGADGGLTFHRSIDDVIATYRVYDMLRLEYEHPTETEGQSIVKIRDARYWEGPRWNLQRIYVSAYPPYHESKIYYDIVKKQWVADDDNVSLSSLRKDLFDKYHANSEKELVAILR